MADAVIAINRPEEWTEQMDKANCSKKLVVVDFTASWCGPCRIIAPFFAHLSTMFANVIFLKVDVDEQKAIAEKFNVEAMPTFVFIKEGKVNDRVVGAGKKELEKKLQVHM